MSASDASEGVTRRTVLRRAGAAAAGVALAGAGASELELGPVGDARACPVCVGAAVVGAGLVGYSLGRQSSPEPDRSAEEAEADWENWVDFYNRARQMRSHDRTQLEQARRDANGMANVARRDAIMAIYEEAVTGGTESSATTAANDAINRVFAQTKTGVWNHWTSRITEFEGDAEIITGDNFTTTPTTVLDAWNPARDEWLDNLEDTNYGNSIWPPSGGYTTKDVQLDNGDTVSPPTKWVKSTSGGEISALTQFDPDPARSEHEKMFEGSADAELSSGTYDTASYFAGVRVKEPDPSTYDAVDESEVDTSDFDGDQEYLMVRDFWEVLREIENIHQSVLNETSTLVDAHFQAAQDGEIDLTQMTGSQSLLEHARTADSFREIAFVFRSMGWAVADTATVVEFEDGEGNLRETDAHLAWARSDQPDPLDVGRTYDAGNMAGTLYIAYNYETSAGEQTATYGALVGEFSIVAAEDGSSDVAFDHQGVVETSDSPSDVQEEFRATNDAEQDAEDARRDINVTTSGFGFGGLLGGAGAALGGVPGWAWAVAAVGGGYALLEKTGGSDGRAR